MSANNTPPEPQEKDQKRTVTVRSAATAQTAIPAAHSTLAAPTTISSCRTPPTAKITTASTTNNPAATQLNTRVDRLGTEKNNSSVASVKNATVAYPNAKNGDPRA